jgi:hypothetical protein
VAQALDKGMNEEHEQTDGKLVEVRPWELVDPHVLHV